MPVAARGYTGAAVNISAPEEMPYVDLQVVNYYHRLMVRTSRFKYLIVPT